MARACATISKADHGAVVLTSRPLLCLDAGGRVAWSVGDSGALAGRPCWELVGCGATSIERCAANGHQAGTMFDAVALETSPCLIAAQPEATPSNASGQLLIWGPQRLGAAQLGALLPVVAGIAAARLAADLAASAGTALEMFRVALGADGCELFLADLYGTEMLLTAAVGIPRASRVDRVRFEPGVGFAGLACLAGEPLATTTLAHDPRFRRRQRDAVLKSLVSVAIVAPDGHTMGCFNAAWRRDDVPVGRIAEMIAAVMPLLGSGLCAAYWTLRERIVRPSAGAKEPVAAMLRALSESVRARSASLVIWDEENRTVRQAKSVGADPPTCPWLASPEASPCSSRENGSRFRLMALAQPEKSRPEPCRQMRFDGASVCCIPITGRPGRSGRVLLGFDADGSNDPLQLLIPLHVMAEAIGREAEEPAATPAAAALVAREAPRTPQLKIRCFGHFEVQLGEQELPRSAFPRRDAVTLLKMLVLRAGKQVHRERLVNWLWPGVPIAAGVNRLHGVVHALRGVIEPAAGERRWQYLRNEGDTYTFSPAESSFVDLIRFQEYLALARRDQRESGFAPQVAHYLEQAVELYRGDLFEDDQGPEWCDVERVALQRQFVEALTGLARIYTSIGDSKRAIDILRRALAYDAAREDLHRELIANLMRLGRHKEAKEQAAECLRILREDIGVEPTAETQKLYRRVVSGE